ncbi:hypothetical protein WIS52_27405 [Pseudonocardia nematodicida]|uniref:Uncharacterized protein n=1 Tax=Pseudonocardia nematodicida TaxID=1206997 RepID=A0ABV1KIC6_9PSEU
MGVGQDAARPRRLVAVALTEAEVVRTGTGLSVLPDGVGETDLLVVRTDPAGPQRLVAPAEAEDYPADDAGPVGEAGAGEPAPDPEPVTMPVPRIGAGRVRVHRLGLRWTVQDGDEDDLVAALSELVGFDPDEHTFCVAPATTGPVADPEIEVVRRAVRRVARVYGLPVLPYRPLADGPVGHYAQAAPVPDGACAETA